LIFSINIIQFIFAVCVIYQIAYWWYFYYPLIKHLKKNKNNTILGNEVLPAVSVLICAKNESENLKNNLPAVLAQKYPHFEVIVIDDYSDDDTLAVLENFERQYQHLTIINKHNFDNLSGKKAALTAAIKQSKYNVLLFTDADCDPASDNWIRWMVSKFDDKTEIVLGYGPYKAAPTFLNRFIRYETYQTIFNYAGFALKGLTYMGVGRNLAYKKKIFEKIDGFDAHQHIASGDDDLLIAQAATPFNTKLCLNQQAWCYSEAKPTWKAYIQQKRRHVSTANEYKLSIKLLLALYAAAHIFIYSTFLFCFFEPLPVIFVLFIVRLIVLYGIYNKLHKQFFETDDWLKTMLFDLIFIAYYFISYIGLYKNRDNKW